jgi:hypothetical protein
MAPPGRLLWIGTPVKIAPVRGVGARGVGAALKISVDKVLQALEATKYKIKPKYSRYDCLQTDGLWAYAGKKKGEGVYAHAAGENGGMAVCV